MAEWQYLQFNKGDLWTALDLPAGFDTTDTGRWADAMEKFYEPAATLALPDEIGDTDATERLFAAANHHAHGGDQLKSLIRHRSMSVGDIARNLRTGEAWICMPVGWKKIPTHPAIRAA